METNKRFSEKFAILYNEILDEHRRVFETQSFDAIYRLMQAIQSAKRVFVTGAGREGIAARSFAMRMMHLGKETHWLWDDTTPGMKAGDLFIVVNGSGHIGHIDYLIDRAKQTGAKIAIVTGAPANRTPEEADICVFVPAHVYKGTDRRSILSVQPMGNLFEQHLFLLFDIVVLLLSDFLQISYTQMEARHRNIE